MTSGPLCHELLALAGLPFMRRLPLPSRRRAFSLLLVAGHYVEKRKEKLSLCLVRQNAMKMQGGVEV
jgi:hypothetical protein